MALLPSKAFYHVSVTQPLAYRTAPRDEGEECGRKSVDARSARDAIIIVRDPYPRRPIEEAEVGPRTRRMTEAMSASHLIAALQINLRLSHNRTTLYRLTRGQRGKKMRIGKGAMISAALVCCALLLRGGCTFTDMQYKRELIPAKLKTGLFYAEGSCGGLLSYQGAYIFNLDRETIESIERDKLQFFSDIDTSMNAASEPYFDGEWKQTPFPDERSDGSLSNMYCAIEHSWRWPSGIPDALRRPGGYYKSAGGRVLVVLPRQGYIVAIVSDR